MSTKNTTVKDVIADAATPVNPTIDTSTAQLLEQAAKAGQDINAIKERLSSMTQAERDQLVKLMNSPTRRVQDAQTEDQLKSRSAGLVSAFKGDTEAATMFASSVDHGYRQGHGMSEDEACMARVTLYGTAHAMNVGNRDSTGKVASRSGGRGMFHGLVELCQAGLCSVTGAVRANTALKMGPRGIDLLSEINRQAKAQPQVKTA